MNLQLDEVGIRGCDTIFPDIPPGPHGAENWNRYGEREGKRWCVPTEDWMGPGGVKLDEPIRKKLRGDEAGLLTDIDPPGVST